MDEVSFGIARGAFVSIVGPSGAGKTTLLQLIGAMDTPTSGLLSVDGQDMSRMSDGALTRLRRERIGFVFQHFGLLPTLTVEENIALPAMFSGTNVRERVNQLLDLVGLTHRRRHPPSQLSGGEMQRCAIARALINSPQILLADEPTGNLDTATGTKIIELMTSLQQDGLTVVVVTHNEALAQAAQQRIEMKDGRISHSGLP